MIKLVYSDTAYITFRGKENWFSSNLRKGFLFAFLAHLFFFCFVPLPINTPCEERFPLTHVAVEVDLTEAHPNPPKIPYVRSPEHEDVIPELPDFPLFLTPLFEEAIGSEFPDFSELERIPYTPFDDDIR